tara:strand:- start:148 stop:312 length:165 start_codon:yes stop_codon:yes gene_type:complete
MKKFWIFLFLSTVTLANSGCFTADVDESQIPQSRPANWEHSGPSGFGGGGFLGR